MTKIFHPFRVFACGYHSIWPHNTIPFIHLDFCRNHEAQVFATGVNAHGLMCSSLLLFMMYSSFAFNILQTFFVANILVRLASCTSPQHLCRKWYSSLSLKHPRSSDRSTEHLKERPHIQNIVPHNLTTSQDLVSVSPTKGSHKKNRKTADKFAENPLHKLNQLRLADDLEKVHDANVN